MKIGRLVLAVLAVLSYGTFATWALGRQSQLLPAGANTTNPSAPFYIDLTGLDFSTNLPTRNPLNPNYPHATQLPDGHLPPVDANGNFIIGRTHQPAPEVSVPPTGTTYSFTMRSSDSKIYPTGLVRVEPYFDYINQFGQTAPGDFSTLLVPNCFTGDATYCSEVGTWKRVVQVYLPGAGRTCRSS